MSLQIPVLDSNRLAITMLASGETSESGSPNLQRGSPPTSPYSDRVSKRLFVGSIPKDRTQQELFELMRNLVEGELHLYPNKYNSISCQIE